MSFITDPDPHLTHLAEANRFFADQIKTADQKAAYVFTFLVAFLVWSSETRRAFDWGALSGANWPQAATAVLLSASIFGAILAALAAVLPRRRGGGSFLYWGAWPKAGEALAKAREAGDESWLFHQYMANTAVLAEIAAAKFRLVTLSFCCLLVAIPAYAVDLVLR